MNKGREPKSFLWWWRCELQQVHINKLVNHHQGGDQYTHMHAQPHLAYLQTGLCHKVFLLTWLQRWTLLNAAITHTQIHTLEPNPLNLLVNTVKADEKRPVQDNDLHVMSIHLSCATNTFTYTHLCTSTDNSSNSVTCVHFSVLSDSTLLYTNEK